MSHDATTETRQWWCNFCGFRTTDRAEYLAHSCQEVLAKEGKSENSEGRERHCR